MAGADAVQKVAGSGRDLEHQAGHARGSEIIGLHGAKHYATSNKPYTSKPAELVGEVKKTNLETFYQRYNQIKDLYELVKEQNSEQIPNLKPLLRNLHPRDLYEAYGKFHDYKYLELGSVLTTSARLLRQANEVIFEKLSEVGLDRQEQLIFLISLTRDQGGGDSNLYLYQKPSLLVELSAKMGEVCKTDRLQQASKRLFSIDAAEINTKTSILFASQLGVNLYDPLILAEFSYIPITKDALLDVLSNLSKIELPQNSKKVLNDRITYCLIRYVDNTFLTMATEARVEIDTEQIRNFFEEARELGIPFNEEYLKYTYTNERTVAIGAELVPADPDNLDKIAQVIREVYGFTAPVERKTAEHFIDFAQIDQCFADSAQEPLSGIIERRLTALIAEARDYFDEQGFTDEQRMEYITYIDEKISQLHLTSKRDIAYWLSQEGSDSFGKLPDSDEARHLNDLLRKFNLRVYIALSFFEKDSPHFYQYMSRVMEESGIDPNLLDTVSLVNLCQGLLEVNSVNNSVREFYLYGNFDPTRLYTGGFNRHSVEVRNWNEYYKLPFIDNLINRQDGSNITDLRSLSEYLKQHLSRTMFYKGSGENNLQDLFGDDLFSLIFAKNVRESFLQIIKQGVKDSELDVLYGFLRLYYPDGEVRNELLRAINKRFLYSKEASFDQKLDYLIEHYSRVGPEGMVILADQIDDYPTYLLFRSRMEEHIKGYLSGTKETTMVALGDYASSFLAGFFGEVLETSLVDERQRRSCSTTLASGWFWRYFDNTRYGSSLQSIRYDDQAGKFIINKRGVLFETVADTFSALHNLSPLKRFSIAHKLLTDTRGAFASEANRKILAKMLNRALGLKNEFIRETLRTAAVEGDPKFIGFPAANMIGPLLFRGLDVGNVNDNDVARTKVRRRKKTDGGEETDQIPLTSFLRRDDIVRITSSGTREVTFFGADYRFDPSSQIAQLAQQTDRKYYQVREGLLPILETGEKSSGGEGEKIKIDPSLEAVIKGVESVGALGVRALQLITQLLRIKSPNLKARLSQSFDANPGLNKLLFWENLHDLAQEDSRVADLLGMVKIKGYLGGGSLYTTYAASFIDEDGREEEVVLKLLRPNIEAFIDKSYNLVKGILDSVAKRNGKFKNYANKALTILGLSKDWCLADVQDETFEEDDDNFAQTVSGFNQRAGRDVFTLPARRLNLERLKVETRAPGQTVNSLLKDGNVPVETKREAVECLSQFFIYQLREAPQFQSTNGKVYRLVHSDPHIGNYVIDTSGSHPKIAVIDRHMYLKLEDADIRLIERFFTGGNHNQLVYSFIDRVLDVNGKINPAERSKVISNIFRQLAIDYTRQLITGKVDKMVLLNDLLTRLADHSLDVPVELRLMVRNVEALKGLTSIYGVVI